MLAAVLGAVPATDDPVADILALATAYRAFALAGPQRYAFMFADPLPGFVPDSGLRAETVQTSFAPLYDAVRRAAGGNAQTTTKQSAECLPAVRVRCGPAARGQDRRELSVMCPNTFL